MKKIDKLEEKMAEEQLLELKPNMHYDHVRLAAEHKARRDFARTPEGKMQKAANRQKQIFATERRGQSSKVKVKGFNPRRGGFANYDD